MMSTNWMKLLRNNTTNETMVWSLESTNTIIWQKKMVLSLETTDTITWQKKKSVWKDVTVWPGHVVTGTIVMLIILLCCGLTGDIALHNNFYNLVNLQVAFSNTELLEMTRPLCRLGEASASKSRLAARSAEDTPKHF